MPWRKRNTLALVIDRLVERWPGNVSERHPTCPDTPCLEWTGCCTRDGYGRVAFQGKVVRVHRLIYEAYCGPISEGKEIDHLCRNRVCANPEHLEAVDRKTNSLRGVSFSAKNAAKTHCPLGHPLSGSNLYRYPTGGRACRACTIKCENDNRDRRNERRRILWHAKKEGLVP